MYFIIYTETYENQTSSCLIKNGESPVSFKTFEEAKLYMLKEFKETVCLYEPLDYVAELVEECLSYPKRAKISYENYSWTVEKVI